jgi:hypothetical protein
MRHGSRVQRGQRTVNMRLVDKSEREEGIGSLTMLSNPGGVSSAIIVCENA